LDIIPFVDDEFFLSLRMGMMIASPVLARMLETTEASAYFID
jgi:hypothetical protein